MDFLMGFAGGVSISILLILASTTPDEHCDDCDDFGAFVAGEVKCGWKRVEQ